MLGDERGIEEKKKFGGLAFLLHGNMCGGVNGTDLVLRLGREGAARALGRPHARPMDFTGKPLSTMVYVAAEGTRTEPMLEEWVSEALQFVASLPK